MSFFENYDFENDPFNLLEDIKNVVYPFDTVGYTLPSYDNYDEWYDNKRELERTLDCLENLRLEMIRHRPVDSGKFTVYSLFLFKYDDHDLTTTLNPYFHILFFMSTTRSG